MVESGTDLVDGRRTRLTLTRRGRGLQRRAVTFRCGRLAGALHRWSTDDLAEFDRLLARFAADTQPLAASYLPDHPHQPTVRQSRS